MTPDSAYTDDPRVTPTTRGASFTFHGQVLYVRPDTSGGWDIVDADGNPRGGSAGLDAAIGFFLGEPLVAADPNMQREWSVSR